MSSRSNPYQRPDWESVLDKVDSLPLNTQKAEYLYELQKQDDAFLARHGRTNDPDSIRKRIDTALAQNRLRSSQILTPIRRGPGIGLGDGPSLVSYHRPRILEEDLAPWEEIDLYLKRFLTPCEKFEYLGGVIERYDEYQSQLERKSREPVVYPSRFIDTFSRLNREWVRTGDLCRKSNSLQHDDPTQGHRYARLSYDYLERADSIAGLYRAVYDEPDATDNEIRRFRKGLIEAGFYHTVRVRGKSKMFRYKQYRDFCERVRKYVEEGILP